jgi:hypothetical protein
MEIRKLSELRTVTELLAALTEMGYRAVPPYEPAAVLPDGSPAGFAVYLPTPCDPFEPNTWQEDPDHYLRAYGEGFVLFYPDLGKRTGEVYFHVAHSPAGELIASSWDLADPYMGEGQAPLDPETTTLNELRDRALIWMAAWDDPRSLENVWEGKDRG